MFRQEGGKYIAVCDGCGTASATGQRSFQQAINFLSREDGWESRKLKDGKWRNYCPQCGEEADPEGDLAGLGFTRKFSSDD
jgi:hypothetical protein